MADRSRSRRVRRAIRLLLVVIVVFAALRAVGPGVVAVRDSAVVPSLQEGDIVWVRPMRGPMVRGTVVLARAPVVRTGFTLLERITESRENDGEQVPERADRLVTRVVAAVPGDRVTWSQTAVTARPPDDTAVFRLAPAALHHALEQPVRNVTVADGEVFLVGISRGGAIDSRVTGPVSRDQIRYRVVRVLWPAERRGVVTRIRSAQPAQQ